MSSTLKPRLTEQATTADWPTDQHRLLTPAELADLWSITRQQVYKLMSHRGLPSVQIGTSRRLRLADVEAWLAEQNGGAA